MHPIAPAPTSVTAFVGRTPAGPVATPTAVACFDAFEAVFGSGADTCSMAAALRDFFANGGQDAIVTRVVHGDDAAGGAALDDADLIGDANVGTGMHALDGSEFNLLCIPRDTAAGDLSPFVLRIAASCCAERGAVLIVDAPASWESAVQTGAADAVDPGYLGFDETQQAHASMFFPGGFCGAVAGVFARTDANAGVWAAPAGPNGALAGVTVPVNVTEETSDLLVGRGVNPIRTMPGRGAVVWGARTLRDAGGSPEYRYVNIRRLMLFLERSISEGTAWTVFEPNDESLWAAVRAHVAAFLAMLFQRGAFAGTSASEAFFVRCDRTTMTQADLDAGRLNVEIGVAPVRPAEFVILRIGQWTADKDA